MTAVAGITAIIFVNQFALGIVLADSRASYTVGAGVALRLAGTDGLDPLPEMASLTTFVLAFAAAYVLIRWVRLGNAR